MKNSLLLSTMVACIGLTTVSFSAHAADPGAMHKDKMGGGAMMKEGGDKEPKGGKDKMGGGAMMKEGGDKEPKGGKDKMGGGAMMKEGGDKEPKGGKDKMGGGVMMKEGGDKEPKGGKDKLGGGAMLKGGVVGGGMAGQRDAKQMGGAAKNAREMTGQ